MSQYRWHPEAKSLSPDGGPCGAKSAGLLGRVPVPAAQEFRSIGKETDLIEYRPKESGLSSIQRSGITLGDTRLVR